MKRCQAATKARKTHGVHLAVAKTTTMKKSTIRNTDVWVLPLLISAGPIIAWSSLSPGRPGMGSIIIQPTKERPTPEIPTGCNHWRRISRCSPNKESAMVLEIRLVSNTVGGPVSSGGLLGVIISPTTVSKLPAVNRTIGTVNSIDPNALLDGIGTISSFLCPIAPTIPNGHQVGIGNTIGARCPISIPNLLATRTLQ